MIFIDLLRAEVIAKLAPVVALLVGCEELLTNMVFCVNEVVNGGNSALRDLLAVLHEWLHLLTFLETKDVSAKPHQNRERCQWC